MSVRDRGRGDNGPTANLAEEFGQNIDRERFWRCLFERRRGYLIA